jgi:hypothetical protein
VQLPEWQLSAVVHALPSVQLAPSAFAGFEHVPLLVSHAPTSWHWSLAAQTTGFAPVHAPDWHASVCVHALPSLQVAPFAFAGFEQSPLVTSQDPAAWHWSLAEHTTGLAPVHTPAWQRYD